MNLRIKNRIRTRKKAELEALPKEKLLDILEEKENELKQLNGLIRRLAERNVLLEKMYEKEINIHLSYNSKARWVEKLVYVLASANKLLKATDIVSMLSKIDPYINVYDLGKVCIHLNKAVKFKMIKSYKIPGLKAHYYGLPDWFEWNDSLKPEYNIN